VKQYTSTLVSEATTGHKMDSIVIIGSAAVVIGGLMLLLFAVPTALILWLIGRILGRLASGIAGSGLIAYLIYYAISSHMACGSPGTCDTPGMMLFAPMIYLVIPAACLVTGMVTLKVWIDFRPTS
jgi:hypothetical protein